MILSAVFAIPTANAATSKPKAPKIKKVEFNIMYDEAFVKLNKTKNNVVKAYDYKNKCVATNDNNISPHYTTTPNKYVLRGIKSFVFYKIIARSFIVKNGKRVYSDKSAPMYVCNEITDVHVSNFEKVDIKNGVFPIVKWPKAKGAQKYVVKASWDNKKFYKLKTTKNNSLQIKKIGSKAIKSGASFYVNVTAQKVVKNKTYNSLSNSQYLYIW
jgi:hypothetical protein